MQIQRFLFVSLLCLCTYSLWGQSSTRQTWPLQVGFGLAGNAYLGDYTETDSWMRRVYPGANFSLQKANPRRVQLQVNGGFGKFSDQFEQNPSNLPPGVSPTTFIETSFIYTDMRVKIRPWPYARLQPYLSVGAGFLFFTPRDAQGKDLPNRIDTRFLGEDYNTAIPQLPGGLGVQYRISRQFTLGLDYMYRFTPSDYLDNVGEAGTRNGFDALHGLQLTLYASLANPDQLPPMMRKRPALSNSTPVRKPKEKKPSSSKPPKEETGFGISESKTPDPVVKPPVVAPRPAVVSAAREAEARLAIQEGRYVYYKVKRKDTLESISKDFQIPTEMIRTLNFIPTGNLQKGQSLRLPDIR